MQANGKRRSEESGQTDMQSPDSHARSLRVGVLFGGRSGEHEVSLRSARNIMDALRTAGHQVIPLGITPRGRWLTGGDPWRQLVDQTEQQGAEPAEGEDSWALLPHAKNGHRLPAIDVVFPVLHGTYGEDGTVQGLLEMANLPYVGCGVLASAVAMDKGLAKQIFAQAGFRQPDYRIVLRKRWRTQMETVMEELEHALGYPLFVKPANLGSSVGISRANGRDELAAALELACRYDRRAVVEIAVPNAREIEVSVLGNDEPEASLPGEIRPHGGFYDYEAKYVNDSSELIIPAAINSELTALARSIAIDAFRAIDGAGLARVDFLLDDAEGVLYLNEINTLPGFTQISMYPKLWEASGVSSSVLVDRLLQLALERYEDRQENSTTREL